MTARLDSLTTPFGTLTVPSNASVHQVPTSGAAFADAFAKPLGLPELHQCAIPGDQVTFVVDPETPQAAELISHAWELLDANNPDDLRVTILFPSPGQESWAGIIEKLPMHIRNQAAVQVHDPRGEEQRSYLASSSTDERIYLATEIVEADLIVTIGVVCFDPEFGIRGAASAIYPVFSDEEGMASAKRLIHSQPSVTASPLRKLADEIGWLLGTQFAIQVVPDSAGSIHSIACGAPEEAFTSARQQLESAWPVDSSEPSELVIAVCSPTLPAYGWTQAAAALRSATQCVDQGGRIILLADLPEPTGAGMQALLRSNHPSDIRPLLEDDPPADAEVVLSLLDAFDQATVLLRSNLPEETAEALGCVALADDAEIERLLAAEESATVLMGANWCSAAAVSSAQ